MNSGDHRKALKTFYKYQSWIFRLLAIWKLPDGVTPRYRLIHKIYFNFILICWVLSFDVSCFIHFINNINDLDEVIKIFFIFATSLAVLSKFVTVKLKNLLYNDLIETIQRPVFRPVNSREVEIFKKSQYLSRAVRNIYCGLSLCALHAVLVLQLFVDTTKLPISIYNPVNINNKWCYFMMYAYQYITVSICCYTNIAFESISASFLIHIKAQLDILCDRLENLGTESYKVNDYHVTLQLKNCVRYYDEILCITRIVENLSSFPISVQIACSVLVLVANFYAMSILSDPSDFVSFIKIFVYQLCMLMQIFILCYFPSEVTMKSQKVSYYLYCSNWVDWNKSNRNLLLLMMNRFDIPIRIQSINPTYTFNLVAFTSIVNSSYSYFALLKRVNN